VKRSAEPDCVAIVLNREVLLSTLFRAIVHLTAAWVEQLHNRDASERDRPDRGTQAAGYLAAHELRILRAARGSDIVRLSAAAKDSAVLCIECQMDSIQDDRSASHGSLPNESAEYVGILMSGESDLVAQLTREFPSFTIPDVSGGSLPGSANENVNFEYFRRMGR
jgi:hypothetical protein